MSDRRKHPRALVPLSATVFQRGQRLGDYLVSNVSAGGALLVHGPHVEPGVPLRIALHGAAPTPCMLDADVVRLDITPDRERAIGVSFRHVSAAIEDTLQQLVLRALESVNAPKLLLAYTDVVALAELARQLRGVGQTPIAALTRLEIVRLMSDPAQRIIGVVVDLAADPLYAAEVLDFARESYPGVVRIAIGNGVDQHEFPWSFGCAHANAVLESPWSRSELRHALSRLKSSVEVASFENTVF